MTGQEGDWQATLADVNRRRGPSKVVVAHLHPGEVSTSFQQSLTNSITRDLSGPQRFVLGSGRMGLISTQQGAGQLHRGRNDATAMFLDTHRDADLLLFADSDMGWDADAIERLARRMDDTGLPVIGGLCFGAKPVGHESQQSMAVEWFPTLYRWATESTGKPGFDTGYAYPEGELVEVGATGAAFLMMHRTALEKVRAAEGDNWFTPVSVEWDGGVQTFGEDMSACRRFAAHGIPVHVDTGIQTSHMKTEWFTESDYRDRRRPRSAAVTVVIPVKDRFDLTSSLVGQLNAQGGWTDILIYDNGSVDEAMREWLEEQSVATVFDASGAGIHEMWNAGLAEARSRHGGLADVVFLNNDLRLGPAFCQRLVGGMRDGDWQAVSGNYDKRPHTDVRQVRGICAGRYDGTGGLAGFAFALRAEWAATYRFPQTLSWYFGDNDLCLAVEKAGASYGIVGDAAVTHIDGGGQTAGTTVGPSFADDLAEFRKLWPEIEVAA